MGESQARRVFVTGGAGFIGSHVVDRLLAEGHSVTVYDNLSSGQPALIERRLGAAGVRFTRGDLLDTTALIAAMEGHDLVWHLAANTDIRAGSRATDVDLKYCVVGTCNVLEAMRQNAVGELLFASSGVVYGDVEQNPLLESAGPLLPVSLYGAGKLSGEAFVSAYCHLFGLRAWIFRFANVVGGRTRHGVVYDFIQKLRRSPDELEVLGDGNQLKPYLLVDECVDGMLFAYLTIPLTPEHPCDVFNLGTDTCISVKEIAGIAIEAMGLTSTRLRYTGGRRGWPGDAPVIQMGVEKLRRHGWVARHTSEEAVRIAARQIVAESSGTG
ncbi:MAG TPA: NAD-dependent epimerase/dehydratase family protein [Chloroflexota bacterium]|nr:NAD-dependent epimerase/dehydratase family protein [Chloroflexota bacterium]